MIKANDIQTIEVGSPAYPAEWQSLPDKPQQVYAVGRVALLTARKFTVVGSRTANAVATKLGKEISKALSYSFAVITGTAEGGDTAAIEGALAGSGNVICVLAGGFAAVPQGNWEVLERVAKRGLVLSPHSFDTPVRNFSYEYRNKLLAALGKGTLVLSAGEKSGALITGKYTKKQGKPLFALPYAPNSPVGAGCNRLIKEGAYLVENANDVFERLGMEAQAEKPPLVLTADEEAMYRALQETGEAHAAAVAERAGIPIFKAKGILASLEVKGAVLSLGANRYTII
ncbi:MAG: DNA-processing protein DprA [Clostridia bacterium]|nr:DNA-processing protein DprA [Clostridia bacterium]